MPTDNLPRLLLKLLDDLPAPTVSAKTLAAYDVAQVKDLQRRRILRSLPEETMLDACGCCDTGCLGRPVTSIAGKPFAVCPTSSVAPLEIDPLELKSFEIDEKETCRQLRQGNGLQAEGIESIAPSVWMLGRDSEQRLVFVAFRMAPSQAQTIAGCIATMAKGKDADILVPNAARLSLPARNVFAAQNLCLRDIVEDLDTATTAPLLSLRTQPQETVRGFAHEPELVMNVEAQSVKFRGHDVPIGPVPFRLLLTLAKRAVSTDAYMPSAKVIAAVWGKNAIGEDLRNNLRRVRDAFKKAMGTDFDPKSILQHGAQTGTRLAIPGHLIRIEGGTET